MPLAPSARARLHATAACVGGWLLWWRLEYPVILAVAVALTGLAALAWLRPRSYAPVQRVLDRVLHALLAGFSWAILALVFVLVFIPLRLLRPGTRTRFYRPAPRDGSFLLPSAPLRSDRFLRQF